MSIYFADMTDRLQFYARAGYGRLFEKLADALSADDWRDFLRVAATLEDVPEATHQFFEKWWIARGDVIRRMVDDDVLVADGWRALVRPYEGPPIDLYRAQAVKQRRHLGFSWTTDPDAASTFGRCHRWNRRGGCVVLKITAAPPAVVSVLRTGRAPWMDKILGEVFVDVRHLEAPPEIFAEFPEKPTAAERALFELSDPIQTLTMRTKR